MAMDLLSRIADARLLIDGDVSDITDGDELREALVQLEALANSAQAVQAQVMVAMVREAEEEDRRLDAARSTQPPAAPDHENQRAEFVADEVGVLLSCSRVAATRRLATALDASAFSLLAAAWRDGRIDARKVSEIADGVAPLNEPHTVGMLAMEPLLADAIDYATTHTVTQVRAWLSRRVMAAAPEAAERRHQKALADRRVTFVPLTDGMAELTALMPAIQARQVFDTINAVAHEASPGEVRTMDQRRSDALFDLLVGRADPVQVSLQVVVPADVLAGESDDPGWASGIGPITAGALRDLAPSITWRRLTCDPDSGVLTGLSERQYRPSAALDRAVRARDMTCRFPGCRRSAVGTRSGTDLDHTIPWPEGPTSAGNLAVLCRRHHRLRHTPGWQAHLMPNGVMEWTTPSGRRFRTEPWQYTTPESARDRPGRLDAPLISGTGGPSP